MEDGGLQSIYDHRRTVHHRIEEEYQIVHPATRELRWRAQLILPEAQAALGKQVTPELYQSQIEIGTSICHTVAEVCANIVQGT